LADAADREKVENATTELLSNAATLIQHVAPRIWDRVDRES